MCEYCKHKYANSHSFDGEEDGYGMEIAVYNHVAPVISFLINNFAEKCIDINYCPMCGRKLKGESE